VALAHPDGERSMFPDSRANQLLSHSQFHDDVWHGVTWLSMSGYTLLQPSTRDLALHVMRMARARGVKVALDPASSTPISAISREERAVWFAEVDLLLPNEQELHALAPHADWRESVLELANAVPAIIVKRGADGSAICVDKTITEIAAIPTVVIDTVGAGDAYAAGTLLGLDSGLTLHESAQQGAKIATFALNTRGAQPASML
jgi:sugar/nucleoside kinase (ribokinase family)